VPAERREALVAQFDKGLRACEALLRQAEGDLANEQGAEGAARLKEKGGRLFKASRFEDAVRYCEAMHRIASHRIASHGMA
jgi:hypothetical protein